MVESLSQEGRFTEDLEPKHSNLLLTLCLGMFLLKLSNAVRVEGGKTWNNAYCGNADTNKWL